MSVTEKIAMPERVEAKNFLTIEEIMTLLPHRYPMLLIDRLEQVVLGESAVGIKNVTFNEWFFLGHFPQKPVMPGVLLVEALAQTAGTLVMHTLSEEAGKTIQSLVYFMSIEEARFRRPVCPGDAVQLKVQRIHRRGKVWKFKGEAIVNDRTVAEATYTAMIAEDSKA